MYDSNKLQESTGTTRENTDRPLSSNQSSGYYPRAQLPSTRLTARETDRFTGIGDTVVEAYLSSGNGARCRLVLGKEQSTCGDSIHTSCETMTSKS